MKVNAFLNKRTKREKKFKGSINMNIIAACATIVSGIAFGTIVFLLNRDLISKGITNQFAAFLTDFSSKSFVETICSVLLKYLSYFFIMLILATCSLGYIPALAVTFLTCVGISALITFIISSYGLPGLEYCLLINFPGKSVFMLSMLMMSHICIITSDKIKKALTKDRAEPFESKLFYTQSVIVLILIILASFIDTIMIKSFSSLFNF